VKKNNEIARVADLLKKYGYHSQSYNILRNDKSYFFSKENIEGVIAYVIKANVAVVAADPVCELCDIKLFLEEFILFCKRKKLRYCFQSVTERSRIILSEMGMNIIKIGEEPIHELKDYSSIGSKFRSLRKSVNQAKRNGLEIVEYSPLIQRNEAWEKDMKELSAIWKKFKGSGEYSFLIGEPALHNPGDRRYFLALLDNRVEAFVVCTPIYSRNGIYFDVMRRKEKTINGLPQLLFSECFQIFQAEGMKMCSLGTAPLSYEHTSNVEEGKIIKLALRMAFDHLEYFNRFKPLYNFKKQFHPTSWEARYLVYNTQVSLPFVLFALLKAYDPTAIRDTLLTQINFAWINLCKLKDGTKGVIRFSTNSLGKGFRYTSNKAKLTRRRIFR